jgi:hypothetical protein
MRNYIEKPEHIFRFASFTHGAIAALPALAPLP